MHALPTITTPSGGRLAAMSCDPAGPLVAEVIRTTSDPYVGRTSLVRVFSGTLRSGRGRPRLRPSRTFVGREIEGHPGHDNDERVGHLSGPLFDESAPKKRAIAGDIVVVTKLAAAETSDTLSSKDRPALVEPWVLPEPLPPIAIKASSSADEDKLASALQRVASEDVTMRLEHNAETKQVVIWTMGQAHVEADEPAQGALRRRGRHRALPDGAAGDLRPQVRRPGPPGQAERWPRAVCRRQGRDRATPRGEGFEFVDKVVGGSVPRNFIPLGGEGPAQPAGEGCPRRLPLVDIRVTLYDGKAHSVDSSDMAFQTAAALALKEAANAATVALLEPSTR